MLIVVATADVKRGNRERMEEAGRAMIEASRREAGCLDYSYAWDFLQPGVMNAIELWRDEEALRAHFATPHMAAFLEALREMGNPAPTISAPGGSGARNQPLFLSSPRKGSIAIARRARI